MTKQVDVGLFFGESFYEVIFTERPSDAILFSGSFFNLKDPFKSKLPKLIQSIGDIKIESVYVSYRYLERIFKFKLGGSVAQVVTQGFEYWLNLHQHNRWETIFALKSPPDLSSADMIFEVKEKIDSNGQIQIPLSVDELTKLVTQLKAKETKRVCLNLVNSDKNPSHREMIKTILLENQFEIFDPLDVSSSSDIQSWRTSLIEASLAGTFNEMKSDINETLQPFANLDNIKYLYHRAGSKNSRNILSGLFALEDAFFDFAKTKFNLPDEFAVVHLGLENFSVWLNQQDFWKSPWGTTCLPVKKRIDLKVQPTNSFYLNAFDDIEISSNEESFEPGPMCLGRGKIPCVYDILNCESVASELQKKIKDSFGALTRSSNSRYSAEKTFDDFKRVIWNRIIEESSLLVNNETIVFYGDTSKGFEARAKEVLKSKNIVFIAQKDFPKSQLALLKGRSGNF